MLNELPNNCRKNHRCFVNMIPTAEGPPRCGWSETHGFAKGCPRDPVDFLLNQSWHLE